MSKNKYVSVTVLSTQNAKRGIFAELAHDVRREKGPRRFSYRIFK